MAARSPIPRLTDIVDASELIRSEMQGVIPTLWVVLFRVDKGNRCEGDFYTISLNSDNLERLDTSRFGCNSVNISVTEKGLGMVMTLTDGRGHREVREVE